MKKAVLLAFALFLSFPAYAATFISVTPFILKGHVLMWNYEFSWKTSLLAPTEIVSGRELSCDIPISETTKKPIFHKPPVCYDTESDARIAAQKKADKFEADRIADGTSTTMIEAKKIIKKATQ